MACPDSLSWPSTRLERLSQRLWTECNTTTITIQEPQSFRDDVVAIAATLEGLDNADAEALLFARVQAGLQDRARVLRQAMIDKSLLVQAGRFLPGAQDTARHDFAKLARYNSLESLTRYYGIPVVPLREMLPMTARAVRRVPRNTVITQKHAQETKQSNSRPMKLIGSRPEKIKTPKHTPIARCQRAEKTMSETRSKTYKPTGVVIKANTKTIKMAKTLDEWYGFDN